MLRHATLALGRSPADPRSAAAVVAGAAVAALWIAALLLRRADGLGTSAYDQAFFQQLVWRIGEDGQWLTSFNRGSFLGVHFSPLLVVPAVLERLLWTDARLLSLLHAVATAALAPAAYLFLREALRPSRAAVPVALGLALPVPAWAIIQEVIRADFHPEVAGVAIALLAGWAGLTGRRRAMWLLALVALLAREDVSYAVFSVALVVHARGRGPARWHGLVLAAVAVAWAVVVFGVLMPWLRDGAINDTTSYYAWLGSGPAVLTAPLRLPAEFEAALTRPATWFVVVGLLVSLAGLPLLRPRWLALLAPPVLAIMLSRHPAQHLLLLQYPIILVAPVLAAAAMGSRRALAIVGRRRRLRAPRWRRALVPALVAPALAVAVAQGAVPPFDPAADAAFQRPSGHAAVLEVATAIPAGAALLVDEDLAAPLAGRAAIRLLIRTPAPDPGAYILLDTAPWGPGSWAAAARARVVRRVLAEDRPVLVDDGRFVLLGPATADAP